MSDLSTKRLLVRKVTDKDRRKFRRVIHETTARCLWQDGTEFEALTVDLCAGGVSLKTDQTFEPDAPIIIYIDQLGRIAGHAARPTEAGFAVRVNFVPQKREKFVDQLTWIVNKQSLGLEDERRSLRRTTTEKLIATYESGVVAQCNVIDISLLGVALRTTGPRPEIGSRVQVGRRTGRCARYVDNGFAIEFIDR
ncbi:pilus assembly protein PilZ [Hirschia litorea]|uniref:Pilus assembly protein PilZ n=1 Tax=Hirschia litorea TaxID=1199156 RepID=A0ABW2ILH4_9PROT